LRGGETPPKPGPGVPGGNLYHQTRGAPALSTMNYITRGGGSWVLRGGETPLNPGLGGNLYHQTWGAPALFTMNYITREGGPWVLRGGETPPNPGPGVLGGNLYYQTWGAPALSTANYITREGGPRWRDTPNPGARGSGFLKKGHEPDPYPPALSPPLTCASGMTGFVRPHVQMSHVAWLIEQSKLQSCWVSVIPAYEGGCVCVLKAIPQKSPRCNPYQQSLAANPQKKPIDCNKKTTTTTYIYTYLHTCISHI